MPTNELEPEFFRDYARLNPEQREKFKEAVRTFVDDLKRKRPFRPSLRVKGVQGHPNVFEMTWDMPDGRATFAYGTERVSGESHIIWRRVGGHEIFKRS
jgi:hypothetical protein